MSYLSPLVVDDFVEALELLQAESSIARLMTVLVERLENAHHLPLSYRKQPTNQAFGMWIGSME